MNMMGIRQGLSRNTLKALALVLQCALIRCPFGLLAATAAQAEELANSPYKLEANPSVCISYDREQPCTMPLHIRWQGPTSEELCLQELLKDPLLQCWHQQQQGAVDLQFSNTTDVGYRLQDQRTATTVADTSVKVINRDLRNSRKRRRHVWSIF
jgi:hypothetical protein